MVTRIIAVAKMSAWGFVHGRAFVIYFCLLAFPWVTAQFSQDILSSLLASCETGRWVAAFFALNAVSDETRQRTLAAVMVRPIAAWEYLAGRALALVGLFVGFVALCVMLGATLSSIGMQATQLQEFVTQAVTGAAWIVILVPLAGLLRPWPCIWLFAVVKLVNFVANQYAEHAPVLAALKMIFYYAGMSSISTAEPWLWSAALLDTLVYGVAVFGACLWFYQRRDVPLREG